MEQRQSYGTLAPMFQGVSIAAHQILCNPMVHPERVLTIFWDICLQEAIKSTADHEKEIQRYLVPRLKSLLSINQTSLHEARKPQLRLGKSVSQCVVPRDNAMYTTSVKNN